MTSGSSSEPSQRDRLLAETAVERGLLSTQQIEECLEVQQAMRARGQQIELGQILLKRKLVDSGTLGKLLRATKRREAEIPKLDRYDVVRRLGEGGMAVVYEGVDRQLGRKVAIKALQDNVASRDTGRKRFLREARAIARLSHPNVVTVHDVVQTGERMYLVMEHVEGAPLLDAPAFREAALPGRIAILEKVARGVHHAHEAGIVHRDLKPANVLVSPEGVPKILDFGLAHLVDAETVLTRSEATLGTPKYMAPEQVKGGGKGISPKTDVFALGVILYEALTGVLPHTGESAMEVYARICNVDPEPPRKLDPSIPRELEAIALKCLEKEPARRYASAGALADDLAAWLDGGRVLARPTSALSRAWKKGLRHRTVLIPAAIGGVLVVAFVVLAALSWRGSRVRIAQALETARAAEAEGDLERARSAFRLVLELDDDDPTATEGLDRTTRALEDAARRREEARQQAIRDARFQEEAITRIETGRLTLEKVTRYLYEESFDPAELARRIQTGRVQIEKAVELAPRLVHGHLLLARIQELLGRGDLAEASLRRAIEMDSTFGPARYRLGRLLVERAWIAGARGSPDARAVAAEAARELEAALAEGSGIDDPLEREVAAAALAWCRGDAAAVRETVRRATARSGGRFGTEDLHWILGLAVPAEEAVGAFGAALEVRPRHAPSLLGRALALSRLGRTAECHRDRETLRAATPTDGTYREALDRLLP